MENMEGQTIANENDALMKTLFSIQELVYKGKYVVIGVRDGTVQLASNIITEGEAGAREFLEGLFEGLKHEEMSFHLRRHVSILNALLEDYDDYTKIKK